MKKLDIAAVLMAVSFFFISGFAQATGTEEPPRPPKAPPQGCTPGYWKNHTDSWVTFSPYYGIDTVFSVPAELYSEFAHVSMLDALSLKGGSGIDGAARILLRHSMAALLNMRHPGVNYPIEKDPLIELVDGALASLDRDEMIATAGLLAMLNEIGCPLN